MKSWWQRNVVDRFESAVIAAVMILLVILFIVMLASSRGHAGGCIVVEVPPQAVIGQPDGDTFHLFTFGPGGVVKIRVSNVDTPERGQPGFEAAKQFTRDWLRKGPFIVDTCGGHTFDRIEATVDRDGETLAEALRKAGYAQ